MRHRRLLQNINKHNRPRNQCHQLDWPFVVRAAHHNLQADLQQVQQQQVDEASEHVLSALSSVPVCCFCPAAAEHFTYTQKTFGSLCIAAFSIIHCCSVSVCVTLHR